MIDTIHRWLQHPALWLVMLVCYWAALFVGTHLPPETPGLPAGGMDKPVHAAAFAVLAVLLAMTWRSATGELSWRALGWMWAVLLLYGALDEWTQGFVGRNPSFWDWVADAVGAAAGLALVARYHHWRRPSAAHEPGQHENR